MFLFNHSFKNQMALPLPHHYYLRWWYSAWFAVIVVAMSSAAHAQWRPQIQLGAAVSGKAVFNATTSPVAASQITLNSLPDASLIGRLALDTGGVARLEGEVGFAAYFSRSVSTVSGIPAANAFRMNARVQAASVGAMLNLYDFVGIGFAAVLPLSGSYTSNVEVFDAGKAFDMEQEFMLTRDNLRSPVEVRVRLYLAQFPLGQGTLVIHASGLYALNALILPTTNPFRLYIPNMNVVGLDPLAGLRTYNVQPLSFLLGVCYFLNL
jgi:hypothetical protein